MKKAAAVLLILLTAFAVNAQTLKLGRSVSDPVNELANLRELGEYIVRSLQGDSYDSYKILTDGHSDNKAFISLINSEKIDIVVESIYSAALYTKYTEMEPVLLIKRGDSAYISAYIVVRKSSEINSINDLGGKIMALKDKASTPSFFLPAEALINAGFKIREVKEPVVNLPSDTVGYMFTHDKYQVANSVYLKRADAGAVCSIDWEKGSTIPGFIKEGLRVIHETKSIPGLFLMIRKSMPESDKEQIVNLLMKMQYNESSKGIFDKCKITGFYRIGFDWKELFRSVPDSYMTLSD